MDFGIDGKVALVAASSRGLGKAVALELSREGARVVLCSRNRERLEKAQRDIVASAGGDVAAFEADVTDEDQIQNLVNQTTQRFGTIDILINNAGGPPAGLMEAFDAVDYRKAIELNLLSTIALTYAVIPLMKKRTWGRIVNITSVSAKQPINTLILSNTSRAGVLGFAKSIAEQLAPFGITVNSVCPGYTRTERVEELAAAFEDSGKGSVTDFYRNVEATIPMGRLAEPVEFARVVTFLASEAASYVTGVALQIDGGYVKGLF
jgi:3-oxoacyl-[acyl-carrier protein] reductase